MTVPPVAPDLDSIVEPAPTGPGSADAPLAAVASRAFGWSFTNTVVSRLGTLAIGVVLARTLGPASFGTFAVATVAMMAVLSINELGVSLAIVRWREDPATIAPTVTTLSAISSLVLFGLMVASASPFATAMGDPSATPVVRLMAVAVLVNGLVATPAALLQRNFQQGRRLVVDQVNTWLGAVVSLLLALAGMGAMSLAIGRITGSVVSGVLFLRWSPLPFRFGFHPATARALLRFGLPLAGASLIVFAVGYADQLVAGATLGATTLGFYVLAFNLASWPVTIFSAPLRSVAPAAFARLQDDRERMVKAFGEVLQLLTAVSLPVCLLVAGAAGPIVRFVYGEEWAPAAAALAFLGVTAGARIFFELTYDFLVVAGRSGPILVVQAVWVAVLVPALLLGAHVDGLRGLAVAQAAVAVLVVVPAYALLLRPVGVTLRDLVRRTGVSVAAALVVAVSTSVVSEHVASPLLACLLSGAVAAGACCALLFANRRVLRRWMAARRGGSVS